ncbi:MAG TPA: cytochrome c biogenesis protein DipZ, partial [Acidimicrobiales bacterium]|nr:cytochrome c biogenesis protein DipZ [Acidimicrobiales bacterium]
GGLITGVSPCIVPVLPVIAAGGSTAGNNRRPLLIIAGLVASFSLSVLLGSTVLSALGLPQDFLYWLGIAVLLLLALGLLVPAVGQWTERPFRRLGTSGHVGGRGGFVLGVSLGLVFVPCAGPVLAAVSVAAANHRVDATVLFVTLFYAVGAALPLLVLAGVAQHATAQWKRLRRHLPAVRRLAGAVLALTTLAIAFGLFDPLQRDVPGYTSALEDRVESGASISGRLQALSGEHANKFAGQGPAPSTATGKHAVAGKHTVAARYTVSLPDLGRAPNFTGIVAWLNTPGDRPLSLAQLRGKVVLIDFWTYSCINCQRSLPHVEGWYNNYKDYGFVVVGVHTPEFAFEHVLSNVRAAAHSLGVDYPIAVDSDYATWDAWDNEYWPADYLIDPSGEVRATSFGEGGYSTMEDDIRALLRANGVQHLPPPTDVPNKTPTSSLSPESYLGYTEISYDVGTRVAQDSPAPYVSPSTVPPGHFAFSGWWTDHSEEATAGRNAAITIDFIANDVYLVMGGTGTVAVRYDGRRLRTVDVSGIPRLYALFAGQPLRTGLLQLTFSTGVQAYDFTFG